jgi:transcriptional regulator with XRE-family HTH domain
MEPPQPLRVPRSVQRLRTQLAAGMQRRLNNDGPIRYLEDIPTMVRAIRRIAGLSQRELAVATGLSPDAVARIETGQRDPRWSTIARILMASGCHIVLEASDGEPVMPDEYDDARDDGGRHLPAHLENSIPPGMSALMERPYYTQSRRNPRFESRRRPRRGDT